MKPERTKVVAGGEKRGAEPEPKINLKFFYAPHAKEKDWEKLKELLPQADVYAIETPGWRAEDEKLYRDISEGTISRDILGRIIAEEGPIWAKEAEPLYGSHKPVVFIDVPKGHEVVAKHRRIERTVELAVIYFRIGLFDQAIEYETKAIELHAENQRERNDYIKQQIKSLTDRLRANSQSKTEFNVLVRIGAGHSSISGDLERQGIKSERVFSDIPSLASFSNEGANLLNEGKKMPLDLVARSLVELLVDQKIWGLVDNSDFVTYLSRSIVSRLSFDDMKEISFALGQDKNLISELEARGIKVPKTKEEAASMIKEITKKWGPHRAKNQNLPEPE